MNRPKPNVPQADLGFSRSDWASAKRVVLLLTCGLVVLTSVKAEDKSN